MTDIVERLENASYANAPSRCFEAARDIKRLRAALRSIAGKCPATCDMTLAHEMAQEAEEALGSSQLSSQESR